MAGLSPWAPFFLLPWLLLDGREPSVQQPGAKNEGEPGVQQAGSGEPGQNSVTTPQEAALERLKALLRAASAESGVWRRQVWNELRRLEHASAPAVEQGWRALAASGGDADLANWILYRRRHQLPLPEVRSEEGADPVLERALALWGESRHDATEKALIGATTAFPADNRLRDNLDWLRMQAPARISLDGDARHLALAILAARRSKP